MAIKKIKAEVEPVKLTAAEARKKVQTLQEELDKIKNKAYCPMCESPKDIKTKFYYDSDPLLKGHGFSRICRDCARNIALRVDANGEEHSPTKESVQKALYYLNKPFLESVWDASVQESENMLSGKKKDNVWFAYIKNIQMKNYAGLSYLDSDMFKKKIVYEDEKQESNSQELSGDVLEMYKVNKRTVLRFLGYDPFENESIEEQALLYAKLVGYFDESVKDDGLKLEAVIEIVQSFKDVKTINDTISKYKKQLGNNPAIISTIKSLADTKQKMITSALALAKDNGISENNNKRKSKGAGTLSGIIKELQEMNLDGSEVNTFDYETNLAIEDIMTRNHQNQLRQLNPDENDWEKEVIHQKELLFTLQKERDNAVEFSRLLKKENRDLKDFLLEKGLIDEKGNIIENE
nr:MAG TPA: hypothetical protein [Caudoviricetes sp.]